MRAGDYIFVPLINPMLAAGGGRPAAWAGDRHVSSSAILASLKLYGQQVGIPPQRLTLMALRRTATRLRLEAGAGLEEMRAFLDSREQAKFTKSRLRRLPQLPQRPHRSRGGQEGQAKLPVRTSRPFQEGQGMSHGLYAHSQPRQEVLAVLAEDIRGIEQEVRGMRALERGLLDKLGEARSTKEAAQLADAATLTSMRLAGMVEAEKQLARGGETDAWTESVLEILDREAEKSGTGPVRESIRAAARGSDSELTIGTRRLVEEAAATRLVLRRMLALASQAEQTGETEEFIRLAAIYSSGCNRLMRLLRAEKADQGRLTAYLSEMVGAALRQVAAEWEREWDLADGRGQANADMKPLPS